MERTAMSQREVTRCVVMRRVRDGELLGREAATLLGLSVRQVKRLARRLREAGERGLVHGHVGRRSNRAHGSALRARVLELVRAHYSGPAEGAGQRFGPTLAAEHLWEDHQVRVAVPTLRRWMLEAQLWTRVRRARPVHRRRARCAHFGELVQLDGSFHDWFEGRGPASCLLTMIDDATGRTLGHFAGGETTWGVAGLLRAWVERYGVPRALYVDAKSVFVRPATVNELAARIAPVTQFGRMGAKLGIRLIVAKTPQAKGRVERVHGTNQDRLIKKLRVQGCSDQGAANAYLEATYWSAHNARFAVAPRAAADFHLPVHRRPSWSAVFCLEEVRVVGNDWVVRYRNRALQIVPTRRAQRSTGPKGRVVVRETEAGTISIVARTAAGAEQALEWTALEAGPRVPPAPRPAPRPPTHAPAPPAGFTRAGKPLSAKQMAARARWSQQVQQHVERRAARRRPQPVGT